MTAMMIDHGKRVAAGGTRLQWHMIPIADIDLIARNTAESWIFAMGGLLSGKRYVPALSDLDIAPVEGAFDDSSKNQEAERNCDKAVFQNSAPCVRRNAEQLFDEVHEGSS